MLLGTRVVVGAGINVEWFIIWFTVWPIFPNFRLRLKSIMEAAQHRSRRDSTITHISSESDVNVTLPSSLKRFGFAKTRTLNLHYPGQLFSAAHQIRMALKNVFFAWPKSFSFRQPIKCLC